MATPIREQILANVQAQIALIQGAPFESTVRAVQRSGEVIVNVDEYPAVLIVDRGDVQKKHLRGAYENRMTLELRALVREGGPAKRVEQAEQLSADVSKKLLVDETRGGLAKKTWLRTEQPHVGEMEDPLGLYFLTVEILYRVERANPYANTNI